MEFAQTDDTVQQAVDAAFAAFRTLSDGQAQRAITAIANALSGNPFGSTTPQTEMVLELLNCARLLAS